MTQFNEAVSSTYFPETTYKRYSQEPAFLRHAKFLTETALPFISLYKPLATPLAYTMGILGTVQCAESLSFNDHFAEKSFAFCESLANLALIYFQHRILEIAFGISDALKSGYRLYQHKDFAHVLELLSSIVHLTIITQKNSLYWIIISLAIQAASNLAQAYAASQKQHSDNDLSYEKPVTVIAKIAQALIRSVQCLQILHQIHQERQKFMLILDESDDEDSIVSADVHVIAKENIEQKDKFRKVQEISETSSSATVAPPNGVLCQKNSQEQKSDLSIALPLQVTQSQNLQGDNALQEKNSPSSVASSVATSANSLPKKIEPVDFLTKEQQEEVKNHPLKDLIKLIEKKRVILEDPTTHEKYDFGAYFHGFGKGLVNGANIRFQRKVLEDGSVVTELTFKVNPYALKEMQKKLESITLTLDQINNLIPKDSVKSSDSQSTTTVKNVTLDELAKLITYTQGSDHFAFTHSIPGNILAYGESQVQDSSWNKKYDHVKINAYKLLTKKNHYLDSHEISINGLGALTTKMVIDKGDSAFVKVTLKGEQDIGAFYRFLSIFGLEDAIKPCSPNDIEKIKLSFLFRMFYPQECYKLHYDGNFLERSPDELKQKILEAAPEMEKLYKEHEVHPVEILPGYTLYATTSIDKKVASLNIGALTHIITNDMDDDDREFHSELTEEELQKISNILTHGILPERMKKDGKMQKSFGLGGHSAERSVYTQLIWNDFLKDQKKVKSLGYTEFGTVRLYISLEALNRGSYQYNNDLSGTHKTSIYSHRKTIFDFIKTFPLWINKAIKWHEVLIPGCIFPKEIMGISVPTEHMKKQVLDHFRAHQMLEVDALGKERIHGILAEEFISCSQTISEEAIKRCAPPTTKP